MNSESIDKLIEEKAEARRKNRRIKAVSVLAAVVAFCTTCSMITPAFTLEKKTYCGQKAHTHTDACYETVVTPGKKELVCEVEEHTHGDECYKTTKTLICELEENEEHTHTKDCYATVVTLVCDKEEHSHGDGCYETAEETTEKVLRCDKKEHKHSDNCYYDKGTGTKIENSSNWDSMFKDLKLSGDWGNDIVTIASTQIGYREGRGGYTRYGGWYGIPCGDWCAMFASFCINYAGVEGFPHASCCQNWINELKTEKMYHSVSEGEYIPKPGDLVFFDWSGSSGRRTSDHVGIVAEYIAATENAGAKIITIEGNYCDKVCKLSYPCNSSKIMGYGEIPVNPNLDVEIEAIKLDVEYNEMNSSVIFSADIGEIEESAYNWQWERRIEGAEDWEAIEGADTLICSAALDENSIDAQYRIHAGKVDMEEGDGPRFIASPADTAVPESRDFLFMNKVFDLGNEEASIEEEHPYEDASLKAEISQIAEESAAASEEPVASEMFVEPAAEEKEAAAPDVKVASAETQPAKQVKSSSPYFNYIPNGRINANRHPMRVHMLDSGKLQLHKILNIQEDAVRVKPIVVLGVELAILLVVFLTGFGVYKLCKRKN